MSEMRIEDRESKIEHRGSRIEDRGSDIGYRILEIVSLLKLVLNFEFETFEFVSNLNFGIWSLKKGQPYGCPSFSDQKTLTNQP